GDGSVPVVATGRGPVAVRARRRWSAAPRRHDESLRRERSYRDRSRRRPGTWRVVVRGPGSVSVQRPGPEVGGLDAVARVVGGGGAVGDELGVTGGLDAAGRGVPVGLQIDVLPVLPVVIGDFEGHLLRGGTRCALLGD